MSVAQAGGFLVPASPLQHKVRKLISHSNCSTGNNNYNNNSIEEKTPKNFSKNRASQSVKWPNKNLDEFLQSEQTHFNSTHKKNTHVVEFENGSVIVENFVNEIEVKCEGNENLEVLGRVSKIEGREMVEVGVKRGKDWRKRVKLLTDEVLGLGHGEVVDDVLDEMIVEMTPVDWCSLVKCVGRSSWQRAVEVYKWLNKRDLCSSSAYMLVSILSVLGKANQETLAEEIFRKEECSVDNTVYVYNAMMGVYARNGRFSKVQEVLSLMREQGCEPDRVSFNTLINARLKSGSLGTNMAMDLLSEVRDSGIQPDTVTYNTLISACSHESNLHEAIKVYRDMEASGCQPDLWTYNAMISVFGRCELADSAERIFYELESKGFLPDAVTYNSLLYAFCREGNMKKVADICKEMVKRGFMKNEMTYNTIIHMYGKRGELDLALELYRNMKSSGAVPDAVTYTGLIDSLGKAGRVTEAENLMSEMLDRGVKPTLEAYSALICGYAKAGNHVDAEKTFHCMVESGIKPDQLAYSVMMDIFLRSNLTSKSIGMYLNMIRDRIVPDLNLYISLIRLLKKENREEALQNVILDMQELSNMHPLYICSILVSGECFDDAAKVLRFAIAQGYDLDHDILLSILSSYSSSGRHLEAEELLNHLRDHALVSHQLIEEASMVVLCRGNQINASLQIYYKIRDFGLFSGRCMMYESLILSCQECKLYADASQIFTDMRFCGVEPSQKIYQTMVLVYCEMSFPETAQWLVEEAERKGMTLKDTSIHVSLLNAYGNVKEIEKAEDVVGLIRQRSEVVDQKVWNGLMQAYAASGCYEQARAAFNIMMRDGPCPTIETVNFLMQALIVDGRLNEIYVLVQDLQDMGFKISKTTILLMLEAFAKAGNIFEVKKIYHGMKAAGYLPTLHLYQVMIELLSRGKQVRDVEDLVFEMEESGFKPNISVCNSLLNMYCNVEDYGKTAEVYQKIREGGLKADEETYNTLILMYSRGSKPEEGLSLLHEMRRLGLDLKLDIYKSLVASCCKWKFSEQAEELFDDLYSKGYKLDRSFYHIMIKMYRDSERYDKAERLVGQMQDAGVEPSIATMHLLMMPNGNGGKPKEAEKVLDNLKMSGLSLNTLPYTSVVDAYLKDGDYNAAIQKLKEMRDDGLEPDHRIWTCFIYAASLCEDSKHAVILLNALQDTGFDLPLRLLTENCDSLLIETDKCLERLEPLKDNAGFNFVNALENLLWAFERRATASWLFQLAVKRKIYQHDIFRVAEMDWGADFRKLSSGAAFVGLTLWLDQMQDASLEGMPESSKTVLLMTGTAVHNMVSLNLSLKAYLLEMASPFLPSRTRYGVLVAKGHSLKMWLKESPFCFDLELKDSSSIPELNSMQLIEGSFIRRGLVPAFKDINSRLGEVWPKKFSRLALLSDEQRDKAIQAHIKGKEEKLEKMKANGVVTSKRKARHQNRKFVRRSVSSDSQKTLQEKPGLR